MGMLEAKIQDQLEGNFKIAVCFRLDVHKHLCTHIPCMHADTQTCMCACSYILLTSGAAK